MNKTELVAAVALKTGETKKSTELTVNALLAVIEETLAAKEEVQIIGFGTFETKHREERQGRNPATGAALTIPASNSPGFKAGKSLKEAVNK